MRLVDAFEGPCRSVERRELLRQVRDIGERLDYVAARYDRLVQDLTGEGGIRHCNRAVEVANLRLAEVVDRLQEMLVVGHELRQRKPRTALHPVRSAGTFQGRPRPAPIVPPTMVEEDESSLTGAALPGPLVAAGG